MKKLAGWIQLMLALALLGASTVGGCVVGSQLRRDRECDANVRRYVNEIAMFRTKQGRLPRRDELHGRGMAIIDYRIVRASTSTTPGQYALTLWRGERSVQYESATDRTTCDSGASQAALWLIILMVIPALLLFWMGVRTLRAN